MKLALSQLSDKELDLLTRLLLNEKDGLSDEQVNALAVKMGMADCRDPNPRLTEEEYIEKLAIQASLYRFVQAAWHIIEPGKRFIGGWHIEAICEHLMAITDGEITRLIINVPPRSTKSTVVSVLWPAWTWIHEPSHQWLCVSHSDKLATRDNRKMRMLVESQWYQDRWRVTFARDQNQKTRFENDAMGYRIAAGLTSGITGEGGDTIVLDDPQDRDAAMSPQKRQTACEEFDEKISTRLNDPEKGAIVAIGQRLHEQDLFGHMLERGGWEHLVIPMRYEVNHPYQKTTSINWNDPRTEDGELMCPERFPEAAVKKMENTLLAYGTAGQLQQRPAPRGGSMFQRQWFEIVKSAPKNARRARYWDKASTEGGGAYTAGVLMAADNDGYFYVEDVKRAQLSPGQRNKLIRQTAVMDARMYGNVDIWLEQEPGSGGKESGITSVNELAGYSVHLDRPGKSKEVRAEPLAAQAEHGFVKLVVGEWNVAFLDELETFPVGKFKDQVDAAAAALIKLTVQNTWSEFNEVLASGEDPEDESRPFNKEEREELPDFLKSLVADLEENALDGGVWKDDWD